MRYIYLRTYVRNQKYFQYEKSIIFTYVRTCDIIMDTFIILKNKMVNYSMVQSESRVTYVDFFRIKTFVSLLPYRTLLHCTSNEISRQYICEHYDHTALLQLLLQQMMTFQSNSVFN